MDSPFQHPKSRGFVSSAELSMKQTVPSAPGPEGRSRFQKVSLVSRRLESGGSARGREGSPSRVSLLLQAWEKEIVEKTSPGPGSLTPRERSSSSLSLLKDFTAHGPVFSQVYSPAQKPRRQDERGKAGAGDGVPPPVVPPRETPVHRESYVHGTLLPVRPSERPKGGPGEGAGAPRAAEPGCVPAVPRPRQVTVLRTGRDAAESGPVGTREARNGMHDAAGATTAPPQRESHGQDGGSITGTVVSTESSPGTAETTEGSPGENHSPQAGAVPVKPAPRDSERPGDPQTGTTSSPQCPLVGSGSQADPAGAGEGSTAEEDGTISATPPRTEISPGAGSTPENPSSEPSDPESSPEAAAPPKAEPEPEEGEMTEEPQGMAEEPKSSPELPAEPPAPDPPSESPLDAIEEDAELLVDMEIFVDTLRNMEPSEMRKELLARGTTRDSPEEELEIENPYLSPEERALARSLRGVSRVGGDGRVEGDSLLGTLRHVGAEEKGRLLGGGSGEHSVLFRGNVLKGMALLSHFLEQRAAAAEEPKPYSRLDNSVLYSRFVTPSTAPAGDTALPTPNDHNGLGPGGPEMALLEAPSPGSISPVTEEPENTMDLCLPDVLQEDEEGFKKINMRPGKIILFSEAGFAGQKREIWGDVPDATSWELSHTISIRVIRGGPSLLPPSSSTRACERDPQGWVGARRGALEDYRTPEISLFAEENGEGARLKFSGSAEDTRTRGQPLAAASIIVHSGLWLVYSKPFFDDDPYVLEPGGYPNLKAWGAKDPSICSMHPIRLGCPVVERPGEPQVLIYEATGFQGRSFTISRDIYDLKSLPGPALPTVGSLRVLGGCWVGYEKEGFRGHQYLLEEGEYQDWRHWGGYGEELVSLRLIRTDFSDPALVLFEAMDFEEGPSVELSEALPDTQLHPRFPGRWVAYEGTNFSGEQYILEKGVYRSCEDWGATDCRIASAQPILQVGEHNLHFVSKILLFSEPDFLGDHIAFEEDQDALPDTFVPRSCRVRGGSWILFDGQDFTGEQHVLSEGEYPTLSAMGCLSSTAICSLKKVPVFFSEPSIFLHGLECFEGKEIELNNEVRSLQAEGFNNHVLSVRVKGGIWVLCEHGDFPGSQWLLDCTEITNWLTYSGLQHVGSLYPIRQRRIYFRIRSRELELYLSVPDDVEDMKAGRVVVSSLSEQSSSIWYYEDGLIKNQVAPNMSLQVIGPAGKGAKAVLWSETRMPRQTWSVDAQGRIHSQMFEDMILDIKGGRSYDRDHAIVWDMAEERPTQIWDIQVL
ncbi:PREDICTED: absent in melanoma 1-like protein [Chaetura pelagica]|uniref:absent in melanoma 1-like protein n=1 Tax=Chaetura pelagica TaxID=8897 RepID=UPI0005232D9D|nr:PREDICTED: absent in melanoma 1-like protein [Chaetura pelagica]